MVPIHGLGSRFICAMQRLKTRSTTFRQPSFRRIFGIDFNGSKSRF